jgi:hypothetical protein
MPDRSKEVVPGPLCGLMAPSHKNLVLQNHGVDQENPRRIVASATEERRKRSSFSLGPSPPNKTTEKTLYEYVSSYEIIKTWPVHKIMKY